MSTDNEDVPPVSEEEGPRRSLLPSELAQKPALRWPGDVAALTHISIPTLKVLKAKGDCPKLYNVGRAAFTTIDDLRSWILDHEPPHGALVRRRAR